MQPPGATDTRDWQAVPRPVPRTITGRTCQVVPLDPDAHAAALHAAFAEDTEGKLWTWMGYGPFATAADYLDWARAAAHDPTALFFAIETRGERSEPVGVASILAIAPDHGTAEIGHICISPRAQRTTAATEALYLLIDELFGLGYRRCEWKCDADNHASWRAALRLGFLHEGVFANHRVVKGRNRDTAWFAITDERWRALRPGLLAWLNPANFTPEGAQKRRLYESLAQRPAPHDPDALRITTDRLVIRMPHPSEAAAVAQYYRENREHLDPWDPTRPADYLTAADQRRHLVGARRDWLADRALRVMLFRPGVATPIGSVGFTVIMRGALSQCFVGYALAAHEQGNGLMFEALSALIPWAFRELDVRRIAAEYMPVNTRSGDLLRRLGFAIEGRKRSYLCIAGRWEDHVCTALVRPGDDDDGARSTAGD